MKIIINTTSLNGKGGVSNHFNGLKDKFKSDVIFNIIGGRSKKGMFIIGLLIDYIKFILTLISSKAEVVHLNPSLNKKAVFRDAIFLLLAKLFKRRVLVYFHGWNPQFEKTIDKNVSLFKIIYGKADGFCVLAKSFKKKLRSWGISKEIYLETTKIDDNLLKGFNVTQKRFSGDVLFLSRLETEKGAYIALKTANALPHLRFIIAGVGSEETEIKQYAVENDITNVEFTGFISGKEKAKLLTKATFLFLPSYHEGMPTAVLEGMAFGMIVISRPVGGLIDFFEDNKMGYLEESLDHNNFANAIKSFTEDDFNMIRDYNYTYANKHFLASNVAKRLDSIYLNLYNKGNK